MEPVSYNESSNQHSKLRHVFFPSIYGFVSEAVIAAVALILFNLSRLSNQLISKNFGTTNPLSSWPQFVGHLLDNVGQHYGIQKILLFGMWALVGALIYILIFRLLQIGFGVTHSVETGVRYVKQDHRLGVFRWLGSLHDFFIKLMVVLVGAAAVAIGALICFGIASQELSNGLQESFPHNAVSLLISLLAAIVGVRIIVFGITLLSPRFRNWYTV